MLGNMMVKFAIRITFFFAFLVHLAKDLTVHIYNDLLVMNVLPYISFNFSSRCVNLEFDFQYVQQW